MHGTPSKYEKGGFLRNSSKYQLGYLRKTPPVATGPTIRQLALNLQPNPTQYDMVRKFKKIYTLLH